MRLIHAVHEYTPALLAEVARTRKRVRAFTPPPAPARVAVPGDAFREILAWCSDDALCALLRTCKGAAVALALSHRAAAAGLSWRARALCASVARTVELPTAWQAHRQHVRVLFLFASKVFCRHHEPAIYFSASSN